LLRIDSFYASLFGFFRAKTRFLTYQIYQIEQEISIALILRKTPAANPSHKRKSTIQIFSLLLEGGSIILGFGFSF